MVFAVAFICISSVLVACSCVFKKKKKRVRRDADGAVRVSKILGARK